MTLKIAQRGSHRSAVHHNATPNPCLAKGDAQLVSVVSWIGFLASAVSEYSFNLDFPLTPAFWMALALCTMLPAIGHAVVSPRTNGSKNTPTTYVLRDVLLKQAPADVSGPTNAESWEFIVGRMTSSGDSRLHDVIATANEMLPPVIFLGVATTRGPPRSDDQNVRTLRSLTQPLSAIPLSSETHLRDSSLARNACLNGTDQPPIRSAIEGDHA